MKTPSLETPQPIIKVVFKYFFYSIFLIFITYFPASFIGCTLTAPIVVFLSTPPDQNFGIEIILLSMSFGGTYGLITGLEHGISGFIAGIPVIMLLLIMKNKNLLVWISFGTVIGIIGATYSGFWELSAIPAGAAVGGLMGLGMWWRIEALAL